MEITSKQRAKLRGMAQNIEAIAQFGKYELSDVELTNDFPIGVSNEFAGKPVEITVKKGALLIITTKKD